MFHQIKNTSNEIENAKEETKRNLGTEKLNN